MFSYVWKIRIQCMYHPMYLSLSLSIYIYIFGWKVRLLLGVCWIIVFIFIKIYGKYLCNFCCEILNYKHIIHVLYMYHYLSVSIFFLPNIWNVFFLNIPNYICQYTYHIVLVPYFINYDQYHPLYLSKYIS